LEKAQSDLEVAQANYNLALISVDDQGGQLNAWTRVLDAQSVLENVRTPPDQSVIQAATIQVQQAEINLVQAQAELEAGPESAHLAVEQAQINLESAQKDLERTTLVAPFDGTVVAVDVKAGEYVSAGPAITIADLSQPLVEVYLDETDLDKVASGFEVEVTFDALPDDVFTGQILRIDPILVTVDGAPAVRAFAQLDPESFGKPRDLPVGLNAAIEIIGGRAEDALLVPVEALRELSPGQYAVFVVIDGKPQLRLVEVGLVDFANAEIISGLELGDVISTGVIETD
jgi:RND family efflux transporter MFP subunit